MPWLGMNINDLESLDAALVVGSNLRKELPIAALRLRKSALNGGRISFVNPLDFPMHFDSSVALSPRYDRLADELFKIARAAEADLGKLGNLPSHDPDDSHRQIAAELRDAERSGLMLGSLAINHPACLLYTSPSPRDQRGSRMPSSA